MIKVIKRDLRQVEFDVQKIVNAIEGAMKETERGVDTGLATKIAGDILKLNKKELSVEEISDIVENKLMASKRKDVAKAFIIYRRKRTEERLKNLDLFYIGQDIIDVGDIELARENANLNGESFSGKMSKFGSEYSKWYVKNFNLPKESKEAMENGYIHIHDLDHYILGTTNCIFVPFEKLLRDGFSTGNGSVRTPNSIMTAMALVAIIFQSQQNSQFGGVGAGSLDWDLASYVDKSFKKHFRKGCRIFNESGESDLENVCMDNIDLNDDYPKSYQFALDETVAETHQAAESLIHNLNTMSSRAGSQIPFTSINYGTCTSTEGRLVVNAILEATMQGLGNGETPIFPIQIYKCKRGINQKEGDVNYDLFQKAIKCASRRLYPNFVSVDAPYNLQYYVEGNPNTEIATMGCRTRVIADRFGNNHISGKGNLAFSTINLVKLGLESDKNEVKFYESLEDKMRIALDGLLHRFEIQKRQPAKASDFMMREGVWEDGDTLEPGDKVGELLKHGTLSIGFLGLAESMKAIYGKHHAESEAVWRKAYDTIKFMRDWCDKKSEELDLNISLFSTPAEGIAGRYTKKDKETFGEIEGVTDREYYTNSFH